MYLKDELLVDDEVLDINKIEWIKESTEVLDDISYSVYHGVGDSSLVKLHIQDELLFEL